MITEQRILTPWGCFFTHSAAGTVGQITPREGRAHAEVFMIAADVVLVTLAVGVWGELNAQLDTLLDRAEEEDLAPEQSARAAQLLRHLAEVRFSGDDEQAFPIGMRHGKPWHVTLSTRQVRDALEGLAEYLEEMAERGLMVTGNL